MPSEIVAPFLISGNETPILLDKKIGEQIFIYGEYLKRRFKINCCFEKDGDKFIKENGKYKNLQMYSFNHFIIEFAGLFDINIRSGNIFTDNSPIYEKLYSQSSNIYEFICKLYKFAYKFFRFKVFKFRNLIRINDTLYSREKAPGIIFFPHDLSPYTYERVIDFISDYRKMLQPGGNAFGDFVRFCNFDLNMIGNAGTYRYYSELVSRYFLYMYDLLSPLCIDEYHIDTFEVKILPRFIRFPKLSSMHLYDVESDPCKPDPSQKIIKLDLEQSKDASICDLCTHYQNAISYYLYNYRESMGIPITQADYKFLSKYFDSDNIHSSTSTFRGRLIGLYLWDKCVTKPSLSQSSIIEIFIRFYKKANLGKIKSKRQYQKILERTTQSIELGQYLPLS